MEVPEFKRCCCCLPLRRGLITWGYGKIILDLFIISMGFIKMILYNRDRSFDYAFVLWISILFAMDLFFSITFVIGAHKKMYKLIRIYLFYSIVWLSLVLIFFCIGTYVQIRSALRDNVYFYIFKTWDTIIIAFAATVVQVYVILLLRSEYKKLRSESHPVHYTNNAAEAGAQNIPLEYKGNHASDNTDRAITNDNDKQLE